MSDKERGITIINASEMAKQESPEKEFLKKHYPELDLDNESEMSQRLISIQDCISLLELHHKHQMSKELEEAEKEISTIHIGKGTHVFYGDGITDGAKWILNHLNKKIG